MKSKPPTGKELHRRSYREYRRKLKPVQRIPVADREIRITVSLGAITDFDDYIHFFMQEWRTKRMMDGEDDIPPVSSYRLKHPNSAEEGIFYPITEETLARAINLI